MKTPEECLDMIAAAYNCPDIAITETIAVIQLDAWRQGMTDAARIVYDPLGQSHNPATAHDRFNAKKAILAARDAKEEKP